MTDNRSSCDNCTQNHNYCEVENKYKYGFCGNWCGTKMTQDEETEIDNNSCWWDGYNTAKKIFERPQIRWTDKVSLMSNGDIVDFEGRVVGHINMEMVKGGRG